jgi:hypothetical protein
MKNIHEIYGSEFSKTTLGWELMKLAMSGKNELIILDTEAGPDFTVGPYVKEVQ